MERYKYITGSNVFNNGDSFSCNLFYLNYFVGRTYPEE